MLFGKSGKEEEEIHDKSGREADFSLQTSEQG